MSGCVTEQEVIRKIAHVNKTTDANIIQEPPKILEGVSLSDSQLATLSGNEKCIFSNTLVVEKLTGWLGGINGQKSTLLLSKILRYVGVCC